MITAITPTGDRPLAFSLCRRWMEGQTQKPDQWIVVDDGKKPMKPFDGIDYVRRDPLPSDPKFTLAENLKAAIPHIKGDQILIIEDDEYYAPRYIEEMIKHFGVHRIPVYSLNPYVRTKQTQRYSPAKIEALKRPMDIKVVGIGRSRYYHLPSGGYRIIGNMGHASLAQTAISKPFLPLLQRILMPGKLYIDFEIWKRANVDRSGFIFLDKDPLYVGIKGLPGRAGIGQGHNRGIYKQIDAGRKVLRQWIPKDYQVYLDILGHRND